MKRYRPKVLDLLRTRGLFGDGDVDGDRETSIRRSRGTQWRASGADYWWGLTQKETDRIPVEGIICVFHPFSVI